MSDNPYAPPESRVADAAPPPLPRPRAVRIAVAMLWMGFVLGFPSLYLTMQRDPEPAGVGFYVFVAVLVGFSALLNLFIHRGRNWARIAWLGMTLLDFVSRLVSDDRLIQAGAFEQALSLLDLLLTCAVLFLLFTRPGAPWFGRAQ